MQKSLSILPHSASKKLDASIQSNSKVEIFISDKNVLAFTVKIFITQLSNIDTVSQTFNADFFIALNAKGVAGTRTGDFLTTFDPRLIIMNQVEGKEPGNRVVFTSGRDIILRYKCKGTFSVPFRLKDFPFDTQKISLNINLGNYCLKEEESDRRKIQKFNEELNMPSGFHSVVLEEEGSQGKILDRAFNDCDIWWLEDELIFHQFFTKSSDSGTTRYFSHLDVVMKIKREPTSYLVNFVLPSAALTTLAWTCWFVPHSEFIDRCNVTLTLLLTLVAYKFIASQNVPPVGYLTFLDKYTLTCNGFICVLVAENAFANMWDDEFIDDMLVAFLLLCWIFYNIICTMKIWKKVMSLRKTFSTRFSIKDNDGIQFLLKKERVANR